MKNILVRLSAALLAFLMITAAGVSLLGQTAYAASYEEKDGDVSSSLASVTIGSVKSSLYPYKNIKASIKKYADENDDIKAWLKIPNTNINKPIAFSAKDNKYYLYRDVKDVNYPNTTYKNFKETAVYLDTRTVLGETWRKSSKNMVLYGHNWTNLREPLAIGADNNHTMFGQLPSYTNIDFAQKNPYIYFSTDTNEGIWKVFCVASVEVSKDFKYNSPNPSSDDFEALIKDLQARSMYNFDVDVNKNDRILTLSTCIRTYDVGGDQRFIVVARLLRNDESEDAKVSVAVNPKPKKPQFSK